MSTEINVGRRAFLILSAAVLGIGGRAGANARIGTGHIGVGPRGRQLLKGLGESAVALCDPDARSLHAGAALTRPGIHLVKDYRALLERADVDAVVIASPDHWHAAQMVHACEAGKDVYVEMPVCNTLGEARAMVQAAQRFGAIVGCGADGPLTAPVRHLQAQIAAGGLGAVSKMACWGEKTPAGPEGSNIEGPPPEMDWDLWLGPAKELWFEPQLVKGGWRWLLELGGGQVRHQGGQALASCFAALDRMELGTITASASRWQPRSGLYDCPESMTARWELSGLTIDWSQDNAGRPAPVGAALEGAEKSVALLGGGGGTTVQPEPPKPETALGTREETALENWLRCIPGRETPAFDMAAGARVTTLCMLANLAYRLGRPLTWDDAAGAFVNDPQAQRLVMPQARGMWRI